MSWWSRIFWMVMVLIVPGGFLAFLGYAFARAVLERRRAALAQARGTRVRVRDVVSGIRLSDIFRQARAAL